MCVALAVAVVVFAPPGRAPTVDVTFDTREIRGVHGTFGFALAYAPAEALVRAGGHVTLSYAPGPLPASLVVDVQALLASTGISFPTKVDQVIALLPPTVSIPIQDTPIGRYVVESIPVYAASGASVTLDVTLDGQVNATLVASAGTLDQTALVWTAWGGREAVLTAPDQGSATVAATFAYYVSNGYVITFDVLGITYAYPVASFPLGELPFPQGAESQVDTVASNPDARPSSGLSGVLTGILAGVAFGAGVACGLALGWGLAVRRKRP